MALQALAQLDRSFPYRDVSVVYGYARTSAHSGRRQLYSTVEGFVQTPGLRQANKEFGVECGGGAGRVKCLFVLLKSLPENRWVRRWH